MNFSIILDAGAVVYSIFVERTSTLVGTLEFQTEIVKNFTLLIPRILVPTLLQKCKLNFLKKLRRYQKNQQYFRFVGFMIRVGSYAFSNFQFRIFWLKNNFSLKKFASLAELRSVILFLLSIEKFTIPTRKMYALLLTRHLLTINSIIRFPLPLRYPSRYVAAISVFHNHYTYFTQNLHITFQHLWLMSTSEHLSSLQSTRSQSANFTNKQQHRKHIASEAKKIRKLCAG